MPLEAIHANNHGRRAGAVAIGTGRVADVAAKLGVRGCVLAIAHPRRAILAQRVPRRNDEMLVAGKFLRIKTCISTWHRCVRGGRGGGGGGGGGGGDRGRNRRVSVR